MPHVRYHQHHRPGGPGGGGMNMSILLITLLAVVFVTGAGVLALLVGIRTEERHMSLTSGPRTCVASLARRLTGASVRRPQQAPHCRYKDTRR
jgi:hypothetical protein